MDGALHIRVVARREAAEAGPSPEPPPAAPLKLRAQARPPAETLDPRSRGARVRAALRCPYCRDRVGRAHAVVCRRDGCGAVYHRACWAECLSGHGGCAVYGCNSGTSRELSAMGWAWRVARLALAAAVLPPRLLRGVRARAAAPGRGILGQAWDFGQSLTVSIENIAPTMIASAILSWGTLLVFVSELKERPAIALLLGLGGPFLGLLVPPLLAFLGALAFLFARAVGGLLRDEAGALERVVFGAEAPRA